MQCDLLRERDFRLFWVGRTTSELGSGLVPVTLAVAVLDLTGSPSALGLVLTAGFVTRLVLLLAGGLAGDRLGRRTVMIAGDSLRAVAVAIVAALFLAGDPQLWEVLVLVAAYGAGDAFFAPAASGLVAELVDTPRLQQANGLLGLSRSAATVAGPALAGLLLPLAPLGTVFAVDALTFVASLASLALLRTPVATRGAPRARVVAELTAGWREVRAQSWLWVSIAFFGLSNVAIAPLFVLGPVAAGGSQAHASSWGLILASAGVGSLLGDAAALHVRPRRTLSAGYLLLASWALAPAMLAAPVPLPVVCAASALGFGAMSFSNTLWSTALQEHVPGDVLARVSALDWLGSRLLQPVGYAFAGPAGTLFGVSATLVGSAVLHASASVGVALVPGVRRVTAAGRSVDTVGGTLSRR
jgi:MFS family permease